MFIAAMSGALGTKAPPTHTVPEKILLASLTGNQPPSIASLKYN